MTLPWLEKMREVTEEAKRENKEYILVSTPYASELLDLVEKAAEALELVVAQPRGIPSVIFTTSNAQAVLEKLRRGVEK